MLITLGNSVFRRPPKSHNMRHNRIKTILYIEVYRISNNSFEQIMEYNFELRSVSNLNISNQRIIRGVCNLRVIKLLI